MTRTKGDEKMPSVEHHYGAYIVRGRGRGRDGTLVQTDWDYPSTAQDLGWSLARVQRHKDGGVRWLSRRGKGCDHGGTDGTVDCLECGITASQFISAAAAFLNSRAR